MKNISKEEINVYNYINDFFKLKFDENGWYVIDVLGNEINEINVLTNLYNLFGFNYQSSIVYNKWIINTRHKLVKPFLMFLDDYIIVEELNKMITVNKITGEQLNLKKDYLEKTSYYPLIILKDTYLWWFSEKNNKNS